MIRSLTALLALLALLAIAGCGDDSDSSSEGGAADGGDAPKAECVRVDAPAPRDDGGESRPRQKLDPSRVHDVVFETSCGDFTVRLDAEGAPNAAASFASLARKGFYNDTVFHRIVPGFVIQGGDPTASGTGGPGYSTRDRPPADASYVRGVVSMAKAANEPPGTAGSQFYVVTGPDAGLPPEYAIVGEVVEGMDTVMRIEALGTPTEQPSRPVMIERAAVSGS